MISFDIAYFKQVAQDIFHCDSPTGFTKHVIELVKRYVDSYGYESNILNSGALEIFIKGKDSSKNGCNISSLTGLMVRSIKPNGTLTHNIREDPALIWRI